MTMNDDSLRRLGNFTTIDFKILSMGLIGLDGAEQMSAIMTAFEEIDTAVRRAAQVWRDNRDTSVTAAHVAVANEVAPLTATAMRFGAEDLAGALRHIYAGPVGKSPETLDAEMVVLMLTAEHALLALQTIFHMADTSGQAPAGGPIG